ncbi:hypothetical protein [Pseudoalteromonas luteoviolacea]|uniref:Chromosome segregation ATPase n=1 Tax=Pseudoalteromonas luteoviolacea S4054 TaxID=1129367 RepID=A0A0F6AD97_9GAMM|nr:hypothetical protein [Pseudoalteromonas luteoviolacea]AOT06855.1 hypothetical protein S4054249_02730 [Pseudoalteromonas luteoviolacea]AOT11773.1 hypothetical protein S40542_02730 [Pseudoalteromonas luteoviolacea]AOT16685.1 hypothetical protein S4054_02730 [Pseudoalteromonas luteoviolacea]KKE83349.1 hypothetical protein N479_14500 [Pseudoalteromonas luteoviolacea S4054]KZN74034.1 hypothetical protein N481_09985 [Pseudoalteromonas luteoviolacea S4047-1]
MDKRIEPELPSITPDLDQVETYKQSLNPSSKAPLPEQEPEQHHASTKKSSIMSWVSSAAIIALAFCSYGLYQQNQATHAQLIESTKRIAELERTLSATGEEMGLSAGALQANLAALSERTDELWSQMDKLWASAWRRNQSEIKKLKEQTSAIASNQTKQVNAQSGVAARVDTLAQSQTDLVFKLSLLEEQLQAAETLNNQLTSINTDLDKLKSQSRGNDAKQLEIGSSIAQLEMTQNALAEQLERLESRLTSAKRETQAAN